MINSRKIEHINVLLNDEYIDRNKKYFDQIKLIHRALPEINLADVDTSVEFMGKKLTMPLIISSMTGGHDKEIIKINTNLAKAAEKTKIGMAVGSQRVMFSEKKALSSFDIRRFAPNTFIAGNIGAVQLNKGFSIKECQQAAHILHADALFLHINPLQEAVQYGGDTEFKNLKSKIKNVTQNLNGPIIVKEVGTGISLQDAKLLMNAGVKYIDVAGTGGTSWSRAEAESVKGKKTGYLFQDWGIPTPLAIKNIYEKFGKKITVLGSGGIRNGIDIAKAIILGASVCGIAYPFLKAALISSDAVIEVIKKLQEELKIAMFVLGIDNIKKLHANKKLLLTSELNNC
jgi:isopentenyl-diphosphate delta-isomerase